MNFLAPGFLKIVKKRSVYLAQLIENYANIIYTDIDTIWLKDPRPFLDGNYDFWAPIDGVLHGILFCDFLRMARFYKNELYNKKNKRKRELLCTIKKQ